MATLPPSGRSCQGYMVDAWVGISWVQSVSPSSTNPLQPNRKQWKWANVHLLETVGVGEFPLQQDGASVSNERSIKFLKQIVQRGGCGSKLSHIILQQRAFKEVVGDLTRKPVEQDDVVTREQHRMLGQRERGIAGGIGPLSW